MSDQWTEKLSEYLDDELSETERRALESHLAGCPDCVKTLEELRRVVSSAQALKPLPPAVDLWPGIASQTVVAAPDQATVAPFRRRQHPRRISFTLPQLAAASLLLAAVSSAVAWQFRAASVAQPGAAATMPAEPAGAADDATGAGVVPVNMADEQYDAAVTELEKTLEAGRAVLDPATIAIVEQNLAIINVAIEQARQALDADPANGYLSSYLVQARRKKLDLLRRAAALTAESAQS